MIVFICVEHIVCIFCLISQNLKWGQLLTLSSFYFPRSTVMRSKDLIKIFFSQARFILLSRNKFVVNLLDIAWARGVFIIVSESKPLFNSTFDLLERYFSIFVLIIFFVNLTSLNLDLVQSRFVLKFNVFFWNTESSDTSYK